LVSTSTGGTLALKLAAIYPDRVHALINMSPNIAINNPAAFVLNDPWGLQVARMVKGGKYSETPASETNETKANYWNEKYRLEAITELESLVETSMTKAVFEKVTQPSLTLYYYKNEAEQDPEVKVSAMLTMNEQLATPDSLKVIKAIPGAGAHVLGCSLTSKDVETVYDEMRKFMAGKVRLAPVASYALLKK
jgi:pimeloyl-ACP methyl ester carboxylesterase